MSNELLGWGSMGELKSVYIYEVDDKIRRVTFVSKPDYLSVELSGHTYDVSCQRQSDTQLELIIDREKSIVIYARTSAVDISLVTPKRSFSLTNIAGGLPSGIDAAGGGTVRAPMHGQLLEILVNAGDTVKKGGKIAVLEAMKMQHEILAEIDGTVTNIAAKAGTQIAADDLIMEITALEDLSD